MRTRFALASIVLALVVVSVPAVGADEERQFFDGIEARMVGPFRGGRAMVAVGIPQNPHTYYMGTTGGVWKTTNAGASWRAISDDDFGSASVGGSISADLMLSG